MSNKPIVAVTDDNPIAREIIAVGLDDRYEVRQFESGQALLDGIVTEPIDLLLLDVAMPGLSGYQTCRALRAGRHQSDVPVIFLSAHVQLEDRLQGYAAGGDDYLAKPCNLDELEAKIQLATDNHRRARQLAGEVADLSGAALLTAEMMGEVGVVLEFQRGLSSCATPDAIADAIISSLARFGLEGCMRLHTGHATTTRSAAGRASALEASLLDHLAARPDARIVTIGHNLGFSFGSVTLLVRSLAWAATPEAPETIDAMGRARDNVALIVEGAVARLHALDAEHDARQLAGAQSLIALTREALVDVGTIQHALHRDLDTVFETLRNEFENRFPLLGLTADQEESLAGILAQHRQQALDVVDRGRVVEERLQRLVQQLEQSPPVAAAD